MNNKLKLKQKIKLVNFIYFFIFTKSKYSSSYNFLIIKIHFQLYSFILFRNKLEIRNNFNSL